MNPLKRGKFNDTLTKFLMLLLIIYTFIMLGRSIWANVQLQRQAESIKTDIANIQKQNQNLSNLILYYNSTSFKEVEARQKLGLKKPGETVVDVAQVTTSDFQSETKEEQQNVDININKTKELSNPGLWWQYFFK
jgi:cell division protein DivIC